MFQQDLSQPFERIMGCKSEELLSWLDKALPGAQLETSVENDRGVCHANYPDGSLIIEWETLPPRRIALLAIPQLKVRFCYQGLSMNRRQKIQCLFDRATQRGGG